MTIDNRQIAYDNELAALRAIGRCAYLRTADVANLVWSRSSNQSAVRMAQRTLARLEDTGDLLQTKAPGGSVIYYLSEAGARRLRSEGIDAKTGKDAIRTLKNFPHRCKCNYAFVQAELAERRKNYTEHEVLGGRGAIFEWHGKRPDLLVWSRVDQAEGWWWVEIENTPRNTKELCRIDEWLCHAVHPQYNNDYPYVMGTADTPMLGVVMLFATDRELVDLRNRMMAAIEKWIPSIEPASAEVARNLASLFLGSCVHFVLLSDFRDWLERSEPWLYISGPAPNDESDSAETCVANAPGRMTPERQ